MLIVCDKFVILCDIQNFEKSKVLFQKFAFQNTRFQNGMGEMGPLAGIGLSREHSPKGKYHCTADILFDRFGFNQTIKTVVQST